MNIHNFNHLIRAVSNQFIFHLQAHGTATGPTVTGFYPKFSGNVSDKTEEFLLTMQNNFMPWTALSGKCSWFTADRQRCVHTFTHVQLKLLLALNEISCVC